MKLFKDLKRKIQNLFPRKKQNKVVAFNYTMSYNKPQLVGKIDRFGKIKFRLTELNIVKSKKRLGGTKINTKYIYDIQLIR